LDLLEVGGGNLGNEERRKGEGRVRKAVFLGVGG
tara:strand:+ start:406 stop:507 length:102 start_codon:yes stop_codon:yes gene_type:complete